MNRSSIFLNSITCIDYSILSKCGIITGGSYMLSVEISYDTQDNASINFAQCKKLIKNYIDDNQLGFDHKLWVDPLYCTIVENDNRLIIAVDTIPDFGQPYDVVNLELPKTSVKFIHHDAVEEQINLEIQALLQSNYPELNIQTSTKLTNTADTSIDHDPLVNRVYFNFIHGLKNSTSYGCQNIVHGHTSYFEYKTKLIEPVDYPHYKNVIFIYRENLVEDSDNVTIEYTSARGHFKFTFNRREYGAAGVRTIVLDTETTIEHIANLIATEFGSEISKLQYLKVSEGLQNGVILKYD